MIQSLCKCNSCALQRLRFLQVLADVRLVRSLCKPDNASLPLEFFFDGPAHSLARGMAARRGVVLISEGGQPVAQS